MYDEKIEKALQSIDGKLNAILSNRRVMTNLYFRGQYNAGYVGVVNVDKIITAEYLAKEKLFEVKVEGLTEPGMRYFVTEEDFCSIFNVHGHCIRYNIVDLIEKMGVEKFEVGTDSSSEDPWYEDEEIDRDCDWLKDDFDDEDEDDSNE